MSVKIPRVKILPGAFMGSVIKMFQDRGFRVVNTLPDLVVWTGGCDINPELYGEKPHKRTFFSLRADTEDLSMYESLPASFPKVGICRGAQLLNTMFGGKLWQDTDRHHTYHEAVDKETGETFTVSSCHHQMMMPQKDAKILLTAKQSTYRETANLRVERKASDYEDIEAVFCPDINAYCHQGHPELGMKNEVDYFFRMIKTHLDIGV